MDHRYNVELHFAKPQLYTVQNIANEPTMNHLREMAAVSFQKVIIAVNLLHIEVIRNQKILTRSATRKSRDSACYKQVSNDTLWANALTNQSKSEASPSLLPSNLPEARVVLSKLPASDIASSQVKMNPKDYNILSFPTLNRYLINPDQENFTALTPNVSPIISSSFTKIDNPFSMVNPNVLNINNFMLIANQNVIKVDIHFAITNLNLSEPKNVPPENGDCWNIAKTDDSGTRQKQGIGSSVANIVRTVVKGLSGSPHALKDAGPNKKNIGKSHKRPKLDSDVSTKESLMKRKLVNRHSLP